MFKNRNFILVGSRGRVLYKNKLCKLFNKIGSNTMYDYIEFNLIKKDYDFLYIGDQINIINKFYNNIIDIKLNYIQLQINNDIIDIFISDNDSKYFYFLYLILGKKLTIILRNKAKSKGLKLNQYGLYYNDNLRKVPLHFNEKKDYFDNIYIIIKYIYDI